MVYADKGKQDHYVEYEAIYKECARRWANKSECGLYAGTNDFGAEKRA
jgi:hypothetical protein